jgi:UDP-galactose transporter B1
MGSLVEKRSYSPQEWISALLISMGIAIFNLSRIKQQNFDKGVDDLSQDRYWKGMLLLFISLCMDGFLGSCQGFIKREDSTGNRRPPTAVETMLFVNVYSLLFLIPMAIAGGQWNQGIGILKEDPNLCWSLLMLNGVASMGQIFIFLTITWYSSLVCTTITTTRKFFTILFSVLHFGHRFSEWQWMSVCLVFGGLYLSIAVNGRQQHSVPEKTDGKQD